MRNHGTYLNQGAVIVGHNPKDDTVLIILYGKLPVDESGPLLKILAEHELEFILLHALREEMHPKTGDDWFTTMVALLKEDTDVVKQVRVTDITYDDRAQELRFKKAGQVGESYMAIREGDEAILLIRTKLGVPMYDEPLSDVQWWINAEPGRSFQELTFAEFETYGFLAELPQIHIAEFKFWMEERG